MSKPTAKPKVIASTVPDADDPLRPGAPAQDPQGVTPPTSSLSSGTSAGKRLNDLALSDEPLRRPTRREFIKAARMTAAEMRLAPSREKTVVAIYRAPEYLRWGVETLSEEATDGVIEPAAACLLEAGLATIRRFTGVTEIATARRTVLPRADAEMMAWFNSFPIVSLSAEGTDDSGSYRLHVSTALAKPLQKLARSLGLSVSRLALFALIAGLLQAPFCCPRKYRQAMVRALQDLKAVIERRGAAARDRAAGAAITAPNVDESEWTIEDVIGPWSSDQGGE